VLVLPGKAPGVENLADVWTQRWTEAGHSGQSGCEVHIVASRLGVTRKTVYNYVSELGRNRADAPGPG